MRNLQKLPFRLLLLINIALISFLYRDALSQKAVRVETNSGADLTKPINYCWNYSTQMPVLNFASDNEKTVYITLSDGKLISLDVKFADKLWETQLGGEIVSSPFLDQGHIYIIVNYVLDQTNKKSAVDKKTILRSINKLAGLTNWETEIDLSGRYYIAADGDSLIVISDQSRIYSINKTNGRINWSKFLKLDLSAHPLRDFDKLVLGDLGDIVIGSQIITLSLETGQILQKVATAAIPTAIVRDRSGENLVWGDEKGSIVSVNTKTKLKNWTLRKGAKISGITVTAGGLLITCLDNFIYMVAESSGKLLWKKRLAGRMFVEPLINDTYAVVTQSADPSASLIDLRNGKPIKTINLEDNNLFTSDFVKSGNLFIYSTLEGLSAVSVEGECQAERQK